MAIEVTQKYPREIRKVRVVLDGDVFYVLADTRAYGFAEQLEWFDKLKTFTQPDGSIQITAESGKMMVDWAIGIVKGFEGLTENDQPLQATRETLNKYPEILGAIFTAVMEAITPKKANGAAPMDLESGSTLMEQGEPAPIVP